MTPVWSALVRLTHWVMAAMVLFNFVNDTGRVHRWAGYVAATMVVCRLVYGFFQAKGSPARISIPGPAVVTEHLKHLLRRQVEPTLGHNPVGMWAALIMWALVLALGVTGWMSQLDQYWGEDWLLELHEGLAESLQVVVLVHWAGVAVMSYLLKENLARAMVTGRKADHTSS